MAITTITVVENRSASTVALLNTENPAGPGKGALIAPGTQLAVNINVPWAASAGAFPQHHLELQLGGQTRFWIWQAVWANGDQTDYVRFSTDGGWHDPGTPAYGVPAVAGPRTLIVQEDGCFQLVSFPNSLIQTVQQITAALPPRSFCPTQPSDPRPAPPASVPKVSAVAFSMAGPPSDAFDQGVQGRFLYRDSGKRYIFSVVNGVVHAHHPDGTDTPLTDAVSYARARAGERTPQQITLPPFDLIAANGGRVFAKAQGQDAFYFATMDHMFVGADEQGREFEVPSTYFRLDPEAGQPGAQLADLMAPFRGCFADHPAAARFPLFRLLLQLNLADMMMVRLEPRVWHRLELRPPGGFVNIYAVLREIPLLLLEGAEPILSALQTALPWAPFLDQFRSVLLAQEARLQQQQAELQLPQPMTLAPPSWVPNTLEAVSYCAGGNTTTLTAVCYTKVLDIGVGHVHWHEQYEGITGGELQPLCTGALFPQQLPIVNYAYLYRIANGPVRDGDGYIDGTCNFYALVQLKNDATIAASPGYRSVSGAGVPDSYAVLYADEQSYFTQRWRVLHHGDYLGLQLALVKGLKDDLTAQNRLYPSWREETYWCPFRAGLIGRRSRMAVSRQVLLVNGEDDSGNAVLYSINFSYSTMDLTWRWRALYPPYLPAEAAYFADDAAAGAEVILSTGANCVYPQTVRLREDMTIHLKGWCQLADNNLYEGRWYQRYLPAGNMPVPSTSEVAALPIPPASPARPTKGYTHAWKFLPEAVFQTADTFSHFGVYDTVDSRTQYYTLTPATAADVATLAKAGRGPWVDTAAKLSVRAWKFWWAAPLRPPDICGPDAAGTLDSLAHYEGRPERLPTLFNPRTLLRIEQRAGQWVALYWDKRDDDVMPFDGLPMQVVLQNGAAQVTVTLQSNTSKDARPVVPWAAFTWTANPNGAMVLQLASGAGIWRVRMAALDASRPGGVVQLLDVELRGSNEYSWTPTSVQAADLQRYCSSSVAAAQYGTSIWCEDIVGHVCVPDEVRWSRTMVATMHCNVTPSPTPFRTPIQLTIQAIDDVTGAVVPGAMVSLTNYPTRIPSVVTFPANTPFQITLQSHAMFGPRGEPPTILYPTATVSAPGYSNFTVDFGEIGC